VLSVIVFQIAVGPVAFILVSILWLLGADEGRSSLKELPWDTIFLLTGIAILISVLEQSGGLDLIAGFISYTSRLGAVHAFLAFLTGIASAFSSSSGVIMPAFIPMIPGIMEQSSLTDPIRLTVSICVGSHMVDVSPLSTLGSLCIASAPLAVKERTILFRSLLIWGLSMSVVGALFALIFLDGKLI
jgi:di/tricarboxylate transporter